jgi:hypothetical protein
LKTPEIWVRSGGTLLDLVSDPPVEQPLDPTNVVTGDCGATAGDPALHEVTIDPSVRSPLLAGVTSLMVSSKQRLTMAKSSPYQILARDAGGPMAAQKSLGKGSVVLIANRYGATNAGIGQADNALLLVNLATEAAGSSGRRVRFDEYHHGVGFAEKATDRTGGVWGSTPLPVRLTLLYLAAVGLLLVYNGSRRFGPAAAAPETSLRAGTNYVNSMARLYRRAGAADIAAETLYTRFLRDLRTALDAPTDAGAAYLQCAAELRYGSAAAGLRDILGRGDAIVAGRRVSEPDMLNLAQRIEQFRRACQLVGV